MDKGCFSEAEARFIFLQIIQVNFHITLKLGIKLLPFKWDLSSRFETRKFSFSHQSRRFSDKSYRFWAEHSIWGSSKGSLTKGFNEDKSWNAILYLTWSISRKLWLIVWHLVSWRYSVYFAQWSSSIFRRYWPRNIGGSLERRI